MVNWLDLRDWGKSKVLNTAYIWMLTVPLAAQVVSGIDVLTFSLGGKTHEIPLSLPFSWKCLYFSALSFTIASLLFAARCPRMIAQFRDFRAFDDSGGSVTELVRHLEAAKRIVEHEAAPPSHDCNIDVFRHRLAHACNIGLQASSPVPAGKSWLTLNPNPRMDEILNQIPKVQREHMGDLFEAGRSSLNWSRRWSRRCATTFYIIGFALIGIVVMQNLIFVIKSML